MSAAVRDPMWLAIAGLTVLCIVLILLNLRLQRRNHALIVQGRWHPSRMRWQCACSKMQFHTGSEVPDGRGMLHGVRRCQPDFAQL